MKSKDILNNLLTRNVEDLIVRSELEKKLKSKTKLRIKLGIDPTGSLIHIGRAVTLWKLRQFQELGHKITFVAGTFTAQIGDTSDKESERKMLTKEEVTNNFKSYHAQLSKILDMDKVEVFQNGDWFNKMDLEEFFKLTSLFTIQQMTERENFAKRIKSNKPVGLHETLYALLQGYDSVMMKTDLEVGGTDQLFNMLAGRTVQKAYGQVPQSVMTFHILEGMDGRKMSTSWGNCIYIDDEPLEMYGKVMAINDELIPSYFKMATDVPMDVIEQIEKDMAMGANPRDTKASLAREIVARYNGKKAALSAEKDWEKQFRDGDRPAIINAFNTKKKPILDVVSEAFDISKSEARRLMSQGGVKVDDQRVKDIETIIEKDCMIQLGKRRYKKIIIK
ncbi:MAG: tyrosine--tRNA ligase [Candidatus Saccharibacteria bacterium]